MGNDSKKFDQSAGAMNVSDWVALQAEQHMTGLQGVSGDLQARNAQKLDMFSALYGLDGRKVTPGEFGGRSAQLLDEAQTLPQWKTLQAKAEAKPWACASAAEQVLLFVGQPSIGEQNADRKEGQARKELDRAEQKLEQAKADQQKAKEQAKKDEQGGEPEQDGDQGAEAEDGEAEDGDASDCDQDGEGEGDAESQGESEGAEGEGDAGQPAGSEQGSGDGEVAQEDGQNGGQQSGEGAGSEQQAPTAAADAQVAEAEKELQQAAQGYQQAQAEAERARESGKQYRAREMADAMKRAEESIDSTEEAMRGISAGQLAGTEQAFGTPVDQIAREISKNPEFAQIMKWAGRMAITGRAKARQRRGRGSSEVVDVTTGGLADIADALPAEMLGLVDPDLEILLDKSIAEESLQIEEKRDRDPEERGPVVACVDESASMEGNRLMWAKAVAFAMFLRCVEENRPFAVVRFDRYQEVVSFRKPRKAKWDDLRAWLNGFKSGGTDIRGALIRANGFIESQPGFKKADVLLVTDGVGDCWHDIAMKMSRQGRSIYGVCIGMKWDDQDMVFLEESINVEDRNLSNVDKTLGKLEHALAV